MNIEAATLQVNRLEARTKYFEYRDAVRARRKTDPLGAGASEEAALEKTYKAISLGDVVIDINLALLGGGLNADGLPNLAIARADWPFVHAWWHANRCVFTAQAKPNNWRVQEARAVHNVAVAFPPSATVGQWVEGKAQVPMIPPRHRPTGALSYYRILFEAVWKKAPPVDPLLLRRIGGPFYVVLAHWDLTELEQAVLRARL